MTRSPESNFIVLLFGGRATLLQGTAFRGSHAPGLRRLESVLPLCRIRLTRVQPARLDLTRSVQWLVARYRALSVALPATPLLANVRVADDPLEAWCGHFAR